MRSYSQSLQRAISDFGADHAFGKVNKKLKEHYGITVPNSSARTITEHHAQEITRSEDKFNSPPNLEVSTVIGECDGSMIPIVEMYVPEKKADTQDASVDRRKHKRLFWKEARLSLAHAKGSATPFFAGTMDSVEIAGQQLLSCVQQAGATENTHVHCVGDGARWIANQVEEKFGSNGTYLIDFYHLCEYLASAAPHCTDNIDSWLKIQKDALKLSQYSSVLCALQPYLEASTVEASQAPVRACYRYIKNRPEQLDYKSAIDQELPIGSGEVESAHRYVLQERLKLAGAWWKIDNAKNMINLRTCRANDLWDDYWKKAA